MRKPKKSDRMKGKKSDRHTLIISLRGKFRARKIKLRNLLDDVFYNNKSLNFREVQRLEEDLVQLKTQLEKLIGCDKEWLNLSFLPKISKKTKSKVSNNSKNLWKDGNYRLKQKLALIKIKIGKLNDYIFDRKEVPKTFKKSNRLKNKFIACDIIKDCIKERDSILKQLKI